VHIFGHTVFEPLQSEAIMGKEYHLPSVGAVKGTWTWRRRWSAETCLLRRRTWPESSVGCGHNEVAPFGLADEDALIDAEAFCGFVEGQHGVKIHLAKFLSPSF
jgi:hypothetical protein